MGKQVKGWKPPVEAEPVMSVSTTDPEKKPWTPPSDAIPVDALKKKEDTENAPVSEDITTPPGSSGGATASPSGTQPIEKPTPKAKLKTRVKNLSSTYQNRFQEEMQPFIDSQQNEYKSVIDAKKNELQELVSSGKLNADVANSQLQEFNTTKKSEFDTKIRDQQRVEGDKFNQKHGKEIQKWLDLYNKQYGEEDFQENKITNPASSFGKTAWSTFTQDIPSAAYAARALGRSAKGKVDQQIMNAFDKIGIPKVDEDNAEGVFSQALKFITGATDEQVAKSFEVKTPTLDATNKKLVVDDLRAAIDLSDASAESKKYLINNLDKVKSGDWLDTMNYVATAAGQGVGQIPASIGTRGTTSLIQEMGSIYLDSVRKIADEGGMTIEEVINQGKDDVVFPILFGLGAGLLDAYGANRISKAFGKDQVIGSFRKRAMELGKTTGYETLTEGAQGALEEIGVNKASGKSWEETFKSIDPDIIKESALQGGIAGLFLGGAGQATRASINAITAPKIEPPQFGVESVPSVIEQQKISVDPNNPESVQQAAETIQNKVNEESTGINAADQQSSASTSNAIQQPSESSTVQSGNGESVSPTVRTNDDSGSYNFAGVKQKLSGEVDQKSGEIVQSPVVDEATKDLSPEVLPLKDELVKAGKIVEKDGEIEVKQNSGFASQLFKDLKHIAGNVKRALNDYLNIKRDDGPFKQKFGNWENQIMKDFGLEGNEYTIKKGSTEGGFVQATDDKGKLTILFNDSKVRREEDFNKVKQEYASEVVDKEQSPEYKELYNNTINKLRDLKLHLIHQELIRKQKGEVTLEDNIRSLKEIERINGIELAKDYYGEPMIFMHGGKSGITQFMKPGDPGYQRNDPLTGSVGLYFSRDIDQAKKYSGLSDNKPAPGRDIYYTFLRTKKPYYITDPRAQADYPVKGSETLTQKDKQALTELGYDSIIWDKEGAPKFEMVVFDPEQVEIIGSFRNGLNQQNPEATAGAQPTNVTDEEGNNQRDQGQQEGVLDTPAAEQPATSDEAQAVSPSSDSGSYTFNKPPTNQPPAAETQQDGPIYNNAAIFTDETGQTQANIQPELSEEGKQYNIISNDLTVKEAKRIVGSNPLNVVEETVFDESNDMDPTLRRATALELSKRQDNPADRQRIFLKYRDLGTKSAQSQQFGNVAREDPAVQTMDILADNEAVNQKILKQKDTDGKTVEQNLSATKNELTELGKKYGVEVSESDTIDSVVRKIVSQSNPKKTTRQQADDKLKSAADKLRKLWNDQKTLGAVYDPKSQAKKDVELTKALIEYVRALIDKIAVDSGEFVKNIGQQVTDNTKQFAKEVGLEIQDSDLNAIITPEIETFQRSNRYTPPITEAERNKAISSVLNVILPINSTNKRKLSDKPAIQKFYHRLIRRMSAVDPKFQKKTPEDAVIEVSRNLDKYSDVLQGVKDEMKGQGIDTSDIDSIFQLPFFVKKIQQQVVIDDIKSLIRQQYEVQNEVAQSLADKLVNRYGLADADASAVDSVVKAEFAKRIKDASQKELTRLYGTSKIKKPRTVKNDADKIIDAMNMGAFNDDFYSQFVGAKFGIVNMGKSDIAMLEKLAKTVSELPAGELRNKALTDFLTFVDEISDKNKAQVFMRNAMDLWYKSALSGYSTQARSLKGASISTMMTILPAILNNPVATFHGLQGLKSLYDGVSTAGAKTWWHIFTTGQSTFGQDKPQPRSYWDKVAGTPYSALAKNKEYLKAINKTWIAPLNIMWRSMVATDAMFRYGMKGFEGYIAEYNKLLTEGGNKREADFWNKLNERLAKDEPAMQASQAQVEQEIQTLKDKGVDIPVGYESRRLQEITDSKRNQEMIKFETDKSNESVLMNDPVGILGNLYRWMTQFGTPQEGDRKTDLISRMVYRQFFPFMRVATNFLNKSSDFTPIGLVRGIRGGRSTREGWKEMSPEERSRHFVQAAIGATVFTGLAASIFDLDDEKGIVLDPESPIEITGLGLGTGKFQENKDTYPDRKDLSFRIRKPSGEWSSWYSYQDNPIGMMLFPLGQASDDIRFTKFKEKVKDPDTVKNREIGTYMATGLHWAVSFASSLSYQQGMRNLMDLFGMTNRGNSYEEIAVKTATAPVKTIILPNLYKQTYQQAKSMLGIPNKKAYSIPDKLLKEIPLAEQLIDTDEYDQLGYPVIHDMDWPLVPDVLLQSAKANINYREDKPEWKLIYKYPEVTLGDRFKAPERIKMRDDSQKELTDEERNQFTRSAGLYLRGFINESLDYLNTLDAEELQQDLNEYRSTASKYARQDIAGMSLTDEKNRLIDDIMRTTRLKKTKRQLNEIREDLKP